MTSKGYKKTVRIVRKGNGLHANEKKKCLNANVFKHFQDCEEIEETREECFYKVKKQVRHFLSDLPEDIRLKIMEFIPYVVRLNVYQYKYFRDNELSIRLKTKLLGLPRRTTKIHIQRYLNLAHETMQLMILEKDWYECGVLWRKCKKHLLEIEELIEWNNDYNDLPIEMVLHKIIIIFKCRIKLNSKRHKTHENLFKLYGLFIISK